jgi:chromosome partitioning protein
MYTMEAHMIVTVLNIKGGVGKTTTAIALATAAIRAGREARVLDADEQGSATLWADLAEQAHEPLPFPVDPINATRIKTLADSDAWCFIDCAPSGKALDAAKDRADFVVIPTTPAGLDMQQTWVTAENLVESGKSYAVLLTRVRPHTLALAAVEREMEERDASYFDARIPQREDVKNYFGHPFGKDLYGYEAVFGEIEEALS